MSDEQAQGPFVRPLGPMAAAGWSAAFLLVFVLSASVLASIKPGAERDGVNAALLYTASALILLLGIARVHAPEAELREVLGARPIGFVPAFLAAVMGACAAFPLGALEAFVARRWPDPQAAADYEQTLSAFGRGERIAGFLALLFVAPVADELFFRGALASGVLRDRGRVSTAIATATAFAFVSASANLHFFPLYVLMGLVFVHARLATGSVLAALGAHLGYRGSELWQALRAYGTLDPLAATGHPPAFRPLVLGATGAAVVVCALILARFGGEEARAPREGDAT
jgi:membrane protease YdiL (CAAX protease family)